MAVRQVKELLEPDPEFVSIVDRGAARKGWVALKRDAPATDDELTPEVRKGMLRSLASRMGVLKMLETALGGAAPAPVEKDDRPEIAREDVQALVFDKTVTDVDGARAWAKKNGFAGGEIEETEHVIRLRQFAPEERVGKAEAVAVAPGISAVVVVQKVIRKEGDQWVLYTRDGSKVLGRHATREEAEAQEAAIEANKARKAEDCMCPEGTPPEKCQCGKKEMAAMKQDLVEKAGAGNIEGLAEHFADEEHPFTACMAEMADAGYDEEKARNICGRVKAILHEGEGAKKAEFRASVRELERTVFADAIRQAAAGEQQAVVKGAVDTFAARLLASVVTRQSDAKDGEAGMELKDIADKIDAVGSRLGELEKKVAAKTETPEKPAPDPEPAPAPAPEPEAAAKGANAEVLDAIKAVGAKLDTIDERVTKLEKTAIVRKGQGESTPTPESRRGTGGFNLFPWDHARRRANEG